MSTSLVIPMLPCHGSWSLREINVHSEHEHRTRESPARTNPKEEDSLRRTTISERHATTTASPRKSNDYSIIQNSTLTSQPFQTYKSTNFHIPNMSGMDSYVPHTNGALPSKRSGYFARAATVLIELKMQRT
jgi:hypothetical protein